MIITINIINIIIVIADAFVEFVVLLLVDAIEDDGDCFDGGDSGSVIAILHLFMNLCIVYLFVYYRLLHVSRLQTVFLNETTQS